jgi:hypothetical protein
LNPWRFQHERITFVMVEVYSHRQVAQMPALDQGGAAEPFVEFAGCRPQIFRRPQGPIQQHRASSRFIASRERQQVPAVPMAAGWAGAFRW